MQPGRISRTLAAAPPACYLSICHFERLSAAERAAGRPADRPAPARPAELLLQEEEKRKRSVHLSGTLEDGRRNGRRDVREKETRGGKLVGGREVGDHKLKLA